MFVIWLERMKKNRRPKPTDAELALLRVLWERGPSTVRDIWEHAGPAHRTGYTTVLKTLQIMLEKGLVNRDDRMRSHVYQAALTREETQTQLVGHVLDHVFSGSARNLVMRALSVKKASPAELAEIRQLLDEMERRAQ